jgi:hypothetical protein
VSACQKAVVWLVKAYGKSSSSYIRFSFLLKVMAVCITTHSGKGRYLVVLGIVQDA